MNNILVRTLSGAVFISLILVPLFLANQVYTLIVFSGFALLGIIEYGKLLHHSTNISIDWRLNTVFSMLLFFISIVGFIYQPPYTVALVFCLFFVWSIVELWRKENPILNIGVSIYGFMYVCVPFLLALWINTADNTRLNNTFPLLAGMFILIWTNDTFAFLSGKFFGKTKLFERISPKKTWEGTIGGILFTILFAFIMSLLFDKGNQFFWMLSVLFIVPAAILGDLLESLFKRSLGVKDSGNIMPGHGGILDRFDASFVAIPFFLLWYQIYTYYINS